MVSSVSELFDVSIADPPTKYSERDIFQRLHTRYNLVTMNARRFVVAEHVPCGMNWAPHIADFVAFDVWSSKLRLHGHEIKCSRADWLVELKKPWKSEAIKRFMDHWWLVVSDSSIVKDGELPDDWGLMVVRGSVVRAVKSAPKLQPEPMPREFVAAFSRAVQKTASRETKEGDACDVNTQS